MKDFQQNYQVNLFYSPEDKGFIATVPGLKGCSAFGSTRKDALAEIEVAAQLWMESKREMDNEVKKMNHRLKTRADFWDAVQSGQKRFEVRKNDRNFQVGDIVYLVRLDDRLGREHMETGMVIRFKVGFILHGGQFGIEPGYCVLQLDQESGGENDRDAMR